MNLKPKEMLIVTPPNELHFFGPFNRPNVTTMKLKNPTDQTLLFKIKTTAPKRYCVRPNLGVINPNETSTVEICLQPFNYDPNEKNKHKFMVQTMVNPAAEEDVHKAWKEAEQSGQLMDVKLKCVFEMQANAPTSNDTSASAAATADVKKQSPKATNEEKIEKQISNMQSSEPTDTLVDELRQLRDENNVLRKDNVKLKDQMARLLINSSSPTSKPRANEPYTPLMAEKQIPMFYIAIAVAMVIFGILLGKYLF